MVAAVSWRISLRINGSRRGRRTNLEKGLGVFYWFCVSTRLTGSVLGWISGIGKKARVLLGFQQSRFTRGAQTFEDSSRQPESEGKGVSWVQGTGR